MGRLSTHQLYLGGSTGVGDHSCQQREISIISAAPAVFPEVLIDTSHDVVPLETRQELSRHRSTRVWRALNRDQPVFNDLRPCDLAESPLLIYVQNQWRRVLRFPPCFCARYAAMSLRNLLKPESAITGKIKVEDTAGRSTPA